MSTVIRKVICSILILSMLLSITTPASVEGKNNYAAGNSDKIEISLKQLNGNTHQLTIRNSRDTAIGNWRLSFKTNFGLSNPQGIAWSVSKNNTYTFWDPDGGNIASGESYTFTVVSNKKKNSTIHNVAFEYVDVEDEDICTISFDYNYEGAPASVITTIKSGSILSPIANPQRDGYIFVGWYEEPTASISKAPYDFAVEPITTDMTFYALWFAENAQLSDGEMDNLYIEYAIMPNLLLRGMDVTDIKLSDDYDKDGLTLIEEYDLDTNPFSSDTDEDGLSDYYEVRVYGSDPLKKDTDGDGLSDGKELLFGGDPLFFESEFAITSGYDIEKGINASVSITLNGSQTESFEMEKLSGHQLFSSDMPGFIDDAYSFTVDGKFDNADLSFRFDESLLTDPGFNPVIYYINEELQELEELQTTVNGNVATATVEHFSAYILLNKTAYEEAFEWLDVWQAGTYSKADVILVIDDSGSMTSNDCGNNRLDVARNLIENLPQNSRAAIVSFASSVNVLQGLTAEQDALREKLTTSYFMSSGGTYMYSGINAAMGLFDEESEESLKNIVMLTDGETSELGSHSSVLQAAQNAGVQIYTVGLGNSTSYFNNYLKPLADGTGGRFYLASQADELNAIYENIGKIIDISTDTDEDGIADYFEDHTTLFTGTRMSLDKNNPDTDGDGLYDGEEVDLRLQYSADKKKVKVTGRMYSDPTKIDTDGDGLTDDVDASPLRFDTVVVAQTDEYIQFNSGRTWSNIGCSAYDVMDNLFYPVDFHVDNPIPLEEFSKILEANARNSGEEFSDDELAIVGLFNNEGAKLYMNALSVTRRENVFRLLTGRESKYYQHKGLLWWTKWEEVASGTQGGFFKGAVVTEADFNFSMVSFCRTEVDYIDVVNTVTVIGACIITAYLTIEIAAATAYEATAISWYIRTFGVKNGLNSYLTMGSQYYYEQAASSLKNGVLSVVEADASDGKLDGVDIANRISGFGEDSVGFEKLRDLKKYIGNAGEGNDWHHIVEQSQIGKSGFLPQQIHNTSNIISVDHATHMKISGYYNSTTQYFTNGQRVRDWLAGKSFQYQYEFGLKVLRDYGVIK